VGRIIDTAQRFSRWEPLTILVPIAANSYAQWHMDAGRQICYNPAHSRPVL
jgi:hypothetical protein